MFFICTPIAYGVLFGLLYEKGEVIDFLMIIVDEDDP